MEQEHEKTPIFNNHVGIKGKSECQRLVEVEELQQKLNSVQMYIDIGGKAGQFQTKMVTLLAKLGFQASPRAEGLAFFPGEEEGWKRLPSIRLTRAEGALTMRVHASDTLTTYNAGAVNSTPDDVYQRIMRGIVEAQKLYNEYGGKATYVSVMKP
jgi:hypothetical protein